MSFTNFSDLEPYKDITLEEAVNLLLSSIALEEMSLSRLIDAETNKILFVINKHTSQDSALQDALAINKSVDSTIKSIIKLQMLLQFKLENVKEILPASPTSSTTTTSTYTTTTSSVTMTTTTKTCSSTTTHTTTCTTSTCSTTTKECEFRFIGKGRGFVSNPSDEFYCQTADLQVFICSNDREKWLLHYVAQNETGSLQLKASAENIAIDTVSSDRLIILGIGEIEKRSKGKEPVSEIGDFTLVVLNSHGDAIDYRLSIKSKSIHQLCHDSGIIQIKNQHLNLHIGC